MKKMELFSFSYKVLFFASYVSLYQMFMLKRNHYDQE